MAEQNVFFNRLRKLFSTQAIVTIDKNGKRKVVDTDERQINTNLLSLRDRYTKLQRSFYEGQAGAQSMAYHQVRRELFRDYDAMDNDPILSAAADIYADESTTHNEFGEILQIRSNNETIKDLLNNLFYDVLNVEFNLWPWIRNLCKYGDFFLTLEIGEGRGIINVTPQSVYYTERIEGSDPQNSNYVKFKVEQDPLGKKEYENYEMAHFRLLSDTNYLPYGKAMLEGARRVWKQLCLLEDAMMIHRIMRAPEKRIFSIDIGNINPTEVDNYMQKIINKMKKVPFVDQNTGDYNMKYNMQNLTEDFFLPVRGGDSGTKIENLAGLEYAGIDDINYLKGKLFAALKIPKAYLSYDENVNGKCIAPDTMIPLVNGVVKSVSELIDDFDKGVANYVYSYDNATNRICAGEIEWAGYTRLNAEVIRVYLDNGKYIDCTPDHKFMLRDGSYIDAMHLHNGDALMPLYFKDGGYKHNYTTVYQPNTGKYEFVHRVIADQYQIMHDKKVIHHIDFNGRNNYPNNLDGSMNFYEHRGYHSKLCGETLNSKENIAKRTNDPEWRKSCSEGGRKGGLISAEKLAKWASTHAPSNKGDRQGTFRVCPVCGKTHYDFNSRDRYTCSTKCWNIYTGSDRYNTIFTKMPIEKVVQAAALCDSFTSLMRSLTIDRATLYRVIDFNNVSKYEFVVKYMPLALSNKNFIRGFKKYEPDYQNHMVDRIEIISDRIDTCDLTIRDYHNFGTDAGIIIHNSTLAAEDVRFARTIERIQRTVVSELTKIAIVHLAAQGIEDAEMTNFELSLTNASTIYEQEKINLWTEKVNLASSIKALNMLSDDWQYANVFGISEDSAAVERTKIVQDLKSRYRYSQIETAGDDPASPAPQVDVESEIEELSNPDKGGRPKEGGTYGKDKDAMGRDPLGYKENHEERKRETRTSPTRESAMYKGVAKQYINGISAKKKVMSEQSDMLDEKNILPDS